MDEQTPPQPPNDDEAPLPQQTNKASGADEASLRELALALIASHYPEATDGEEPQLLPGQLPPTYPADFPLPPGSRVLGSLVATRPTVVLATDQPGEAVIAFYTEQLTAAGWESPDETMFRHGGFLHSGMSMTGRTYRSFFRDGGPSLNIMALTGATGRTKVLISQLPEDAGWGSRGPRGRHMHADIFSIFPPIMPPPQSQQFQEGGGGGDDRVSTSARVESDLDLPAMAAHYTAELERGGWQRTDGGESYPVAWSTWTFESEDKEPWRAFFVVVKRPDVPRRFWTLILAEWTGKQPSTGSGWASSSTIMGTGVGWQTHSS